MTEPRPICNGLHSQNGSEAGNLRSPDAPGISREGRHDEPPPDVTVDAIFDRLDETTVST